MRNVLIICSLFMFSCVRSQGLPYEDVSQDSRFKIIDADINRDGIKDKVVYNTQGDELNFYVNKTGSFVGVYYGDNYNMDGVYYVSDIHSFTEGDNVLYLKSGFNGAGGQTIEYFISYNTNNWYLSKSFTNSSSYKEFKVCEIDYLREGENENCLNLKFDSFSEEGVLFELGMVLKQKQHLGLFSTEFLFCILNTYPLSVGNVTFYNDLAFYLEQVDSNKEAVYLLKVILQKFSNRTVAYINLADAYWKLDEIDLAKAAYRKYVELMIINGLENKIPSRVMERV